MLSEKEYNLIKFALENSVKYADSEYIEEVDNVLLKLSEHVTVEEVAHKHERRDLDRL
jgi:hypothetical protein|tara:strand:+ start:387 stop:560 length:174 start_codon:yes stop_codon:yes gene_type:complete